MANNRFGAGTHIINHPHGGVKITRIDTEINGIPIGTVTSNVIGLLLREGAVLNNGDSITITGNAFLHTSGSRQSRRIDLAASPYAVEAPEGYGQVITEIQGTLTTSVGGMSLGVGSVLLPGEIITVLTGSFSIES